METKTGRREFIGNVAGMTVLAVGASVIEGCSPRSEQTSQEKKLAVRPATELKTLEVEFGGICLIVRNRSTDPSVNGLFALLPETKFMMPRKRHCGYVLADSEFTIDEKSDLAASIPGNVDLHWLNSRPANTDKLPVGILRITEYAGKPVDPKWLSGVPSDCLLARVRLPLGYDVAATQGDSGPILAPGASGSQEFYGRILFRIPVDTPNISRLKIGDIELKPNANGTIKVRFANLRPRHLYTKDRTKVTANEPLRHHDAYYTLLEGNCKNPPPDAKAILAGRDFGTVADSDNTPAEEKRCDGVQRIAIPKQANLRGETEKTDRMWIDPIQCTVGCGSDGGEC